MLNIKNDNMYMEIIHNIINNEEFNKINNIEHHGISRLTHSLKVSYYSYKIAKFLKLDYSSTARGGLLHDFFLSSNERNNIERLLDTFTHPKNALIKADNTFILNDMEKDMIIGHMFPLYKSIPKYLESWIVNLTDKIIGSYELLYHYCVKLNYGANYLYLFVLLNLVK